MMEAKKITLSICNENVVVSINPELEAEYRRIAKSVSDEFAKYKERYPDVVIGTSMGGMYAQQMFGFKRICVNPAFEMSVKSKVLKVGTFEYFKPRMDGKTHFSITPDIIKHHADMESKQFDGVTDEEKTKVWGLFGSDDRQVNGEHVFRQYYDNVIHFNG